MKKLFLILFVLFAPILIFAQDDYLEQVELIHNVTEISPLEAQIFIDSNIRGAEVYINGEYKGRTKLLIKDLVPSNYLIKIIKKGYEEINGVVEVRQGVMLTYIFSLTKNKE